MEEFTYNLNEGTVEPLKDNVEKEKYYTPALWEFHVGFEYEVKNFYRGSAKTKDNWEKAVFGMIGKEHCYNDYTFYHFISKRESNGLRIDKHHDMPDKDMELNPDAHIRVKYLDKEDIKSLGWTITKEFTNEFEAQLMSNHKDVHEFWYELGYDNDNTLIIEEWRTIFKGGLSDGKTLFHGTIKNKSELGRLLNQLNIIKDGK